MSANLAHRSQEVLEPDPDAEAAWAIEIERRVAAIEAGTAKLEPWTDVKRRIEREILGR
jgi:hypothetical protein